MYEAALFFPQNMFIVLYKLYNTVLKGTVAPD